MSSPAHRSTNTSTKITLSLASKRRRDRAAAPAYQDVESRVRSNNHGYLSCSHSVRLRVGLEAPVWNDVTGPAARPISIHSGRPVRAIIGYQGKPGGPSGLTARLPWPPKSPVRSWSWTANATPVAIPRHSDRLGYGIRDLKRFISGPAYAQRLTETASAAPGQARNRSDGDRLGRTSSPRRHLKRRRVHGFREPVVLIKPQQGEMRRE